MNANATIRAYVDFLAAEVPPRTGEIARILDAVKQYELRPDEDDLRTLGGCFQTGRAPMRFVGPVDIVPVDTEEYHIQYQGAYGTPIGLRMCSNEYDARLFILNLVPNKNPWRWKHDKGTAFQQEMVKYSIESGCPVLTLQ